MYNNEGNAPAFDLASERPLADDVRRYPPLFIGVAAHLGVLSMCLIVEIIMTIMGIIALVKGELKVIGKHPVRGVPAYIIGGLMTATLPMAFAVGFIVGFVLAVRGQAANVQENMPLIAGLEAAVVIGNLLVCIVLSAIFAKEPPPPGALPQGFPQFPNQDTGYPPRPSPPMDPTNPYTPPPGDWPQNPYHK